MGETIFVAIEPRKNKAGEVTSFGKVAYIYPRGKDLWSMDDMSGYNPYAGDCVSLKEACEEVMEFLRNADKA